MSAGQKLPQYRGTHPLKSSLTPRTLTSPQDLTFCPFSSQLPVYLCVLLPPSASMVMWQGQLIAAKQAGADRASSLEGALENSRIEVAQPKQKLAISTVSIPTARDPERLLRQVGLQLPSSQSDHRDSMQEAPKSSLQADTGVCLLQAVPPHVQHSPVGSSSKAVPCITNQPAAGTYQAAAPFFLQAAH